MHDTRSLLFVKGLACQAYHLSMHAHAPCQGLIQGGGGYFFFPSTDMSNCTSFTTTRVSNMFITRTNFDKIKLTCMYTCSYEPMILQTPYNHDCQPSKRLHCHQCLHMHMHILTMCGEFCKHFSAFIFTVHMICPTYCMISHACTESILIKSSSKLN